LRGHVPFRPGSSHGAAVRRATIWDLSSSARQRGQPSPAEFRGCLRVEWRPHRANRYQSWRDFALPRRPDGLHEVYFEYDDELEYIARARDADREITRWAGTTEVGFPVVVSALFDPAGVLRGIRMVTDARPEHRNDITEANLRKRADAYMLGGIMAVRFDIETARDCMSSPPAEGESAVGALFIKQSCDMNDTANARKIMLRVSFYRKPGQSGTNPQLPTQLTEGQFESSARLEIRKLN
jgi:hypothetical protein